SDWPSAIAPVVTLVTLEKPRPCANSCSSTVTRLMAAAGPLVSRPRYQGVPVRQPVLPRLELKRARISGVVGSRSKPARLLASAPWYHVAGNSAPGKSDQMLRGPALPNTALLAVQLSGSKVAKICVSTALSTVAPHTSAANWKA